MLHSKIVNLFTFVGVTCKNLLAPDHGDFDYVVAEHERDDLSILQVKKYQNVFCTLHKNEIKGKKSLEKKKFSSILDLRKSGFIKDFHVLFASWKACKFYLLNSEYIIPSTLYQVEFISWLDIKKKKTQLHIKLLTGWSAVRI